MFKNKLIILSVLAIITSLTGCAQLLDDDHAAGYHETLCKRIKRQKAFNAGNRNQDAAWQAPSQQARLEQLYIENDCNNSHG